jgi:adenylate cyclase
MRRNPYHPNWYWNILGRCLHTGKLYDEAVSALERIRTPQFWVHAYLAACYAELGKSQDSARHLEAVFSLKPDFTISEFAKSLPYRDERALGEFIAGLRRGGLPA